LGDLKIVLDGFGKPRGETRAFIRGGEGEEGEYSYIPVPFLTDFNKYQE
jgi:hypothetical protein